MLKETIKKLPLAKKLINLLKGKPEGEQVVNKSAATLEEPESLIIAQSQAFLNAGNDLLQEKKFDKAITCYQEAIIINPEYAEVYYFLGMALAGQKQLDEAIISYQTALKYRPNWSQVYLDIGNLFTQKEECQNAITNYSEALSLQPQWEAAYFYRGNAWQSQENYEKAIEDYQKACKLGLNWNELYENFANCLAVGASELDKVEINQLVNHFQQILNHEHDIGNSWLYLILGHLYNAENKHELAFENYEKSLNFVLRSSGNQNSSHQLYLINRQIGMAAESVEKWTEATKYYKLAMEFNNENENLYSQIANIYAKLEQWDKAITIYQQAIVKYPKSPNFTMALGSLFLQLNKPKEAINYYQQTITLDPASIDAYTQAGVALFLGGQMEEATEPWGQGLKVQRELAHSHELDQLGIRFVGNSWLLAIGHIAMFDTYIKTGMLGWRSPQETWLVVRPKTKIPNRSFLNYWQLYINIQFDEAKSPLDPKLAGYVTDEFWAADLPDGKTHIYYRWAAEVQRKWEKEKRPPLLKISSEDHRLGWDNLEKLGMPRDSWFVCLHVREPGFHKNWNKKYAATRDANIDSYHLAIKIIVEQGGWVVRVGDPSMKPLPKMKQVIDYAHSDLKSDWMDIFLCGGCRFYIGTNSGLALVPPVFGVPCVLTNWNPIAVRPHYGEDIFIPKLYWSDIENRHLSFAEIIAPPIGYSQFTRDFEGLGIRVQDNSPEELQAGVLEMLGRLSDTLTYSEVDQTLQERFDQVALAAGSYRGSRIAQQFLANYSHLLESE